MKVVDEFVLWGFSKSNPTPIKLSGGTIKQCNSQHRRRVADGWNCGIYRKGDDPVGLSLQAATFQR